MFFGISIIPDNEILTERQVRKTQCLCGFRDFQNQINLPLYTKFTPIGAKIGAEPKNRIMNGINGQFLIGIAHFQIKENNTI